LAHFCPYCLQGPKHCIFLERWSSMDSVAQFPLRCKSLCRSQHTQILNSIQG
jgi:hypothetical protein